MSYIDIAVGIGMFILFFGVVLVLSINYLVRTPAGSVIIIELREEASKIFDQIFSTGGTPSNWEDTGQAPSDIGLVKTIYRIPITVEETSGENRTNEAVAVSLDFDDDCSNKTWNNTVRVYDEDFNETPYKLSHENFCSSQFLKNSIITFEVNISANQEKEYYVWYSPDTDINGPNHTLNIKGYWKFDDGSGNSIALDGSGNENNGTLINMNTTGNSSSGWSTDCKSGSCLIFDGVNDYVNVSDSNVFTTGNKITVSAWVKFNSLSTSGQTIVIKSGASGDRSWHLRKDEGPNIMNFWVSSDGTGTDVAQAYSTDTVTINMWYHVVGVYDGSYVTVYLNGTAGTPVAMSGNIYNSVSNLVIGSVDPAVDANHYLNGIIDDVKIWNRVLSATEINATFYSSPLTARTFPEEEVQVVSKKKVDALSNISYDQLREIIGEDYNFRIVISE